MVRRVFRTANAARFPIVVHMRTLDRAYGARDAEVFLRELLSETPDIPVQVAHVAGWGAYNAETDAAFGVFADAITAGDRRTANLYFDVTAVAQPGQSDSLRQVMVRRFRQVGMERLLFGLDMAETARQVRERWEFFKQLPLTAEELRAVATNVAPYFRR
jgi:predicted TIM-barrel fold metal-dependent hydrolase